MKFKLKKNILKILCVLFLFFILVYLIKKIFFKTEFSEYAEKTSEYVFPKEYPNFITDDEADYILEKASSIYETSVVVGEGINFDARKSETAWLPKDDDVVANIIKRVCKLTNYPFENAEDLQVVKYEPGGFYKPHHDSCCDESEECIEFKKTGGARVATMLIYLSDKFEGGSTRFPNLNKEFKPDKCGAVLFRPMEKNGNRCHNYALHGGMPVISGTKYIANVWLREKKFVNVV